MLRQIKRLGAETAVYGLGTVAGRFLNFLLVPFYTNVLVPAEYGVVAYLYSLIAFANVVYWFGMEAAYFKFATDRPKPATPTGSETTAEPGSPAATLSPRAPKEPFSTPFTAMLATSALFSGVLLLARGAVAEWIGLPATRGDLVGWTAGILFLDAVAVIPFAFLRLARMAKMFAWVRFLNVLSNVLLNVVLLTRYDLGVEGIFISGFISSALTVLMLLPVVAEQLRPAIDRRLLGGMLRFALPTVPAGLALMALQVIDRPILRALTDDATVGIYQANYRLGIFMMIAVSIYDYAWRPFFFSHAADPEAKRIFSRVMTYLVLVLSALFLAFVFFVPDIARFEFAGRHFIHPRYWEGLGIVPVVMLGYFWLGVSTNLSAGIYIEKKTHYLPFVNAAGALANIALNFVMIPRFGIAGAAWATFLAYFGMAGLHYAVSRRVYPVEYEWDRLWKILAVAIGLLLASFFLPATGPVTGIVVKLLLLASFPVLLLLAGAFTKSEVAELNRLLRFRGDGNAPRP
jgi:O-antigen/teichoic acid export membrane protein